MRLTNSYIPRHFKMQYAMKFLFPLLYTLLLTATTLFAQEPVELFADSKKCLEIPLKQGWKLQEERSEETLKVFISPPDAEEDSFLHGVRIYWYKTYTVPGQSYTPANSLTKDTYNYRLTNPDSLFLLEEYDAQPYKVGDFNGLLSDREIQLNTEGALLREYELILSRNGELVQINMRSTDDYQWDELMPIYQQALKQMKLTDFMP